MALYKRNFSMLFVAFMVATAIFPLLVPPAGATIGSRAYLTETEPNQLYAQANEIKPGDHASGKINWTDLKDVWKINVTAGKIFNVTLYLIDYNGALAYDYNLNYEVISPAPQFVLSGHYGERRTDTWSGVVYETGFHYIWIYANGTVSTHTKETRYMLSVDLFNATTTGAGTVNGNIDTSLDLTDVWYKLTFPAGQGVNAVLTVPATGDFDLSLWCKWPVQAHYMVGLEHPFMLNASYVNTTNNKEEVDGLCMEGTYYLKVFGWSGKGAFSLAITQASFFDDGDSTPATATTVTNLKSDRIMLSSLSQSLDFVDWYKVHLEKGEYVNTKLELMSNSNRVNCMLMFTDQWYTPLLWQFTTVTGYPYDMDTNLLDGSANINFAPYTDGAPAAGDYYFFVRIAWRIQDQPDFTPADAMYRITWDMPNYGPINKTVDGIPPLKVDEHGTINMNLNDYFLDREGDTLSYAALFQTAMPNVTVDINQGTGATTITPVGHFNNGGTAINMSFKATDPAADWGTKTYQEDTTLTIKPINDAPTVQIKIINITINEDQVNKTNPADLKSVFVDADGDKLIYRVLGADKIPVSIDPVSNQVSLGPVHAWFGEEVITIQAEDPSGEKANVTFKVTVAHVNHPPTGKNSMTRFTREIPEDLTDSGLNLTTLFDDPDVAYASDQLRFKLEYPAGYTPPFHMDVAVDGDHFIITPDPNWTGIEEVPITAYDLAGAKIYVILAISVLNTNDPPIIETVSPPSWIVAMKEGENKLFEVTKPIHGDIDSFLTYTWYLDGQKLPVIATSTKYTLETDFTNKSTKPSAGNHTLKVVVSDSESNASFTWNINIEDVNRAPTTSAISEPFVGKKFKTGEKVTLRAAGATDPDGDKLTYTWKDDSTGQVLGTGDSLIVSFSKAGDHKISLTVTDAKGMSSAPTSVTFKVVKPAQTGISTTMMLAIVVLIVVINIVLVVVMVVMRRRPKEPDNAKAVADNYESQLWGKQPGGQGARPASRPAAPPATPPAAEYGPETDTAAPRGGTEEAAPEQTWSMAGAKTEDVKPEVEDDIPSASASKVLPGPPPPGPPQ